MKTIQLRNVTIGSGAPKVIVPIVASTHEAIIAKAGELRQLPLHVVEWRADFFEDVFHLDKVSETLQCLRTVLGNTPILFTFRTKKEGGEKDIGMSEYTALNKLAARSGCVDAVDVQIFSGDAFVQENIDNIHKAGVIVVGSNHDFGKTPGKEELLYRLRKMQEMGADIPKIAVMPQSESDVLTLLGATEEMYSKYADRPIVTMSMSALGVVSRVCGETFGSSMTFGAVGQVSAPGQIPVEQLNAMLEIIHNSL
ncbi:MAG TPA: type I 3-dehydroquinate dehydratase [Clostridia bacterium]|nr:type I 3-dehydroquinate dehydratase [Clostridia bacterium]